MTNATRYPLSWPTSWRRTPASQRKRAKFSKRNHDSLYRSSSLTVPQGLRRLQDELIRLGAHNVIISTNVELNSYGEPRGGRRDPDDPGVASYFKLNTKDRVLACDRWDRTADNLAAIAAHIDCLRGIDRYGVGTLDQAFAGYDALPPPGAVTKIAWRKVFGWSDVIDVGAEEIANRYKELARQFHPDLQGGSTEAMAMLNAARDEALAELAA